MNRVLKEYQENEIRELLFGRSIISVEGDTLVLDDGKRLEVVANEG